MAAGELGHRPRPQRPAPAAGGLCGDGLRQQRCLVPQLRAAPRRPIKKWVLSGFGHRDFMEFPWFSYKYGEMRRRMNGFFARGRVGDR